MQQQPSSNGADPQIWDPDVHLARLLTEQTSIPWYQSLIQNIRDWISPPQLPPLQVTSKPVAVKEIWGLTSGQEKRAGAVSLVVHGLFITSALLLGTSPAVQKASKQVVDLIAPDIAPYIPQMKQKPTQIGGGGGGGDRSPTPPSKGRLPRLAAKQFTPPVAKVENENPKLVMEPTLVIQPDAPIPQVNLAQFGDPFARMGPPSNGTGSGGGIGTGSGGGVGSGSGPGFGPGSGGNMGGGAFRIGGGVSAPSLLFKVEPEYSEEARKAKYQGTVVIFVVVDEKGFPRDLRVTKPLGLGLDEKAIEAVRKWRFKPGYKDGKPVPVQAYVEVNFRLL